ncbi:hypothetical protein I3843_05G052600 [Carya illinoinensis]|uniref:Uncharacterized protein n=1 Tax=Carya illinoinensis TaxID=32201 RepID=A0A8T1QFD2_CARIL|nr:uncharacterized protein LOC122310025 [Carya illinoinensis]KAG2705555.1 hypothetical protein I3760_05G060500 [Carya illinoinensis]KAG6653208.1 hypothetical protein CIPAW_05G059900 [Carya illinoinensis]KAG6711535.1 hypothetical protein I3842_05G059900 [Carya illinoinensis]KAG7977837.1 hypothetical protein I3843_05G052600 [Carya illinoinensis]
MGICSSSGYTRDDELALNWASTAKLIHLDGTLQEFRHPVKARNILSQNPTCFLSWSDSMYINFQLPLIPENEDLQLGQLYFLMPLSKSHVPLSLQDLCALAIKAHAALTHSVRAYPLIKTSKSSSRNDIVRLPSEARGWSETPAAGFDIFGVPNSAVGQGNRRTGVHKNKVAEENMEACVREVSQ